jgi:putative ABC transport system permease protein
MIKNYLKTAIRSLKANIGFTTINVLGLALGLTAGLLIILYVVDELRYDTYNKKADMIFRVNTDTRFGPASTSMAIAAPIVAGALKSNFPEVAQTVRILPTAYRFRKGQEQVLEERGAFCDPSVFSVFTLPMIQGDPATALNLPHSIVISESTARKYFDQTDVVGRDLMLTSDHDSSSAFRITGVIQDIPAQSHFHFDYLLSMDAVRVSHADYFFALFPFSTYILLQPGTDAQRLEAKFPSWIRKTLAGPDYEYDALEKKGYYYRLNLTPLKDIHLHSNRENELGRNGNIQYIYIFAATALLILVVACINFMNLATARSANRAKEVGVRKVLGSSRGSLIAQFLSESMLVTGLATLIALTAAWVSLPWFNQLSGKMLAVSASTLEWLLPSILGIVLIVGGLAGAYPAFFLSSFQPVDVLKGKLKSGFKGSNIRSFLVIFQFGISIFLIIGTLIVYSQLQYIRNKDLGFDRNRVLVVRNAGVIDHPELLKDAVSHLPGVLSSTLSRFSPTGEERWHNYGSTKENNNSLQTEFWPVDEDYLTTMGMRLVQGRDFSKALSTDTSAIIINETAAGMLSYAQDPLNRKIYYGAAQKEYHVIGIVKDFNFNSLRDNVTPLMMVLNTPLVRRWAGTPATDLHIRIQSADLPDLIDRIRQAWKGLAPQQRFDYSFMDKDFDGIYRSEQRMSEVLVSFTILALFIACLGLLGLAAFAAEQRTKEIGIRKVLGASVGAIVGMLSRDFLKLVFIAILIASPIAWWLMHKWLQDFAYRTVIHWWIPVIAGLLAILIALVTISTQSIRAATADPAKSLKAE